jgi:DNA-directed RNA polymerase specialized sigma24 family protein
MSQDEDPSRKKKWSLDQESFDRLLAWLDPDREVAGRRYEEIRLRLTKILVRRGCYVAEELVDETFNRVAKKLPEIEKDYVGDKTLYFYGVLRIVFKEWIKPPPVPPPAPVPDPPEVLEANDNCLHECLERLSPLDREVMLDYFKEEGKAKIDGHIAMAERLGISISALRTKACRLKNKLKVCVLKCINRGDD